MIQRMPQLFDINGEHDSVILAFWPDADAAALIHDRDGVWEKAEDLHITLAHCGKAPDMTDAQIARVIDAADVLSKEFSQMVVTLEGIGRFDNDKGSAVWAGVTSDQIRAMNARAKELLTERGIEADKSYGDYTPHMTLAYLEPDSESPIDDFPAMPVLFRNLSISVAGRQAHLPLKEERMSILDRLRALIRSADPTAKPVKRDMMMHLVWENVYRAFSQMNEGHDDRK
jgi:2'-5' RNA ligase